MDATTIEDRDSVINSRREITEDVDDEGETVILFNKSANSKIRSHITAIRDKLNIPKLHLYLFYDQNTKGNKTLKCTSLFISIFNTIYRSFHINILHYISLSSLFEIWNT